MPPKRKRSQYMRRYMKAKRALVDASQGCNNSQEIGEQDVQVFMAGSETTGSDDNTSEIITPGHFMSNSDNSITDNFSSDNMPGALLPDEIRGNQDPMADFSAKSMTENVSLKEELRVWMVEHDVRRHTGDALLEILNKHFSGLPSTTKTLLDTPKSVASYARIQNSSGGRIADLGIKSQLSKVLGMTTPEQRNNVDELHLSINIDGLPLFKSSTVSFWPILCCVINILNWVVFPVAFFCGETKPGDLDFLNVFIAETADLMCDGILYSGKRFKVKLKSVICDAPARALMKCVMGHGAYFGCDKCMVRGEYVKMERETCGRVTYPDIGEMRSDQSFRRMIQPQYHKSESPFCRLNIDMVKGFPIDSMHQVFEGVMRCLITVWISGKRNVMRRVLSPQQVEDIGETMQGLRCAIPSLFARKPRSLKKVDLWKGTEFRQFLLYTGLIVLKGQLPRRFYRHFMMLSVAMNILVDDALCQQYNEYAHELLKSFVHASRRLYGPWFVVYNVHSLLHLAAEALYHGSLDRCSAWMFESYLYGVKRMVRSGFKPLEQVLCRVVEKDGGVRFCGPKKPINIYKPPDNAYILDDGTCCEVIGPAPLDEQQVRCICYDAVSPLYDYPCNSNMLGHFKTCGAGSVMLIDRSLLKFRSIRIMDGENRLFLMLRHGDAAMR